MPTTSIVRPVATQWHKSLKTYWAGVGGNLGVYSIASILDLAAIPPILKGFFDSLATSPETSWKWFVALIGTNIVYYVLWTIGDFKVVRLQPALLRVLKVDGLASLLKLDHRFFSSTALGGLVAKLKRYAGGSERVYDEIAYSFIRIWMTLLVSFAVLLIYVPKAAVLIALWAAAFIYAILRRTERQSEYDRSAAEADSRTTALMADIITNGPTIVAAATQREELAVFETVAREEEQTQYRGWRYSTDQWILQRVFTVILRACGIGLALYEFSRGHETIGTVLLLYTYINQITDSMYSLGRSVVNVRRAFADAFDMAHILERTPEITDPAEPECPPERADIRFENVSFGYRCETPVINELSLLIPQGQRVGIVGSSGSGKTTLVRLLQRLYKPTGGRVLIGDIDISQLLQRDLRSLIAYVPQEPSLFDRTLRENIAYYRKDATDAEVQAAAEAAQVHDFILSLPNGYDTLVGERGVKLSGGQRQRIAIARALLANRPIVIFDEASSALDNHTEYLLQQQLLEAFTGKTVLVVAHRLSTVATLDRIIVLHEGEVVEDGSHDELVENGGHYTLLWRRHISGHAQL